MKDSIKYLWRLGKKDDPAQEIKKAIWYLQDYLKELEKLDSHKST